MHNPFSLRCYLHYLENIWEFNFRIHKAVADVEVDINIDM